MRSVLSVIAGFAGMASIVMLGSVVLIMTMVPGGFTAMRTREVPLAQRPSPRYLVANILLSLDAAIFGGWLTAQLAPDPASAHVKALGILVLIMGAVSALTTPPGSQPLWYRIAIPFIGIAGVVVGGFLIS